MERCTLDAMLMAGRHIEVYHIWDRGVLRIIDSYGFDYPVLAFAHEGEYGRGRKWYHSTDVQGSAVYDECGYLVLYELGGESIKLKHGGERKDQYWEALTQLRDQLGYTNFGSKCYVHRGHESGSPYFAPCLHTFAGNHYPIGSQWGEAERLQAALEAAHPDLQVFPWGAQSLQIVKWST